MLQFSTREHYMSLRAKQSAAIYFRSTTLIAKLICFQLWCNLAVKASGKKHTHPQTQTHTLGQCCLVCVLKSRYLLFKTVWRTNEKHSEPEACAHKHPPTHTYVVTYRSLMCTPIRTFSISRLSLARPSIYCSYSSVFVSCVWLWGSVQVGNKGLIV